MPHQIDPDDERALLDQLGSDPDAFNRLYALYLRRVYGYVAARIENHQDAEDVVSDVFLRVVRNLDQFRRQHGLSFAAWIFTIARHAVSDYYRRPSEQTMPLDAAPPSTDMPPDLAVIERENASDLRRRIAALPERRRDVVMLKFFSGLRNQEIAVVLGVGEKTVAANLSRALRDLWQQIQPAEKKVNHDP